MPGWFYLLLMAVAFFFTLFENEFSGGRGYNDRWRKYKNKD